jgi:hypothetical protein
MNAKQKVKKVLKVKARGIRKTKGKSKQSEK